MKYTFLLLGEFRIQKNSESVNLSKLNRKTKAILAYLATTERTYSRRELFELFCHESKDPAGTLRWHLSRIRHHLDPDLLQTNRQTVSLNLKMADSDLVQFKKIVAHPDRYQTAQLATAVSLFRSPFLSDLILRDSSEFEFWVLKEQSNAQRLFENGSIALMNRYYRNSQFEDALMTAQNLIQFNPLIETAHASLVWLYARVGQRESALFQYEQCRRLLWQELAVEPEPTTQHLVDAIQKNIALPPFNSEASNSSLALDKPLEPSVFVGRVDELKQLHTFWKEKRPFSNPTILIDAPAGGGKTQFLQQFLSTLSDSVDQEIGNCFESTQNIPYHPWLSILGNWLNKIDTKKLAEQLPRWQSHLSLLLPSLAVDGNPSAPTQQQLFRTIAQLFIIPPNHTPLILLLEDLQWADEISLQLFQFMAQELSKTSVSMMLIGTYRSEELDDNRALKTLMRDLQRSKGFNQLTLSPLGIKEIGYLIHVQLPQMDEESIFENLRGSLIEATGGNPLFTTEIIRELAQANTQVNGLPIPPSLTALISSRLDQLTVNGRQLLETLAVLDQPAHFDLAQEISGRSEGEALNAIELGLRWRLLRLNSKTELVFNHDLMRQSIVDQLSQIRRQLLHRRTAVALEKEGETAATLTYHWRMAGNIQKEAHFAALAGTQSITIYAHKEAEQYLQRAIQLEEDDYKRLNSMIELGDIWAKIGKMREAEEMIQSAQGRRMGVLESYMDKWGNIGKHLIIFLNI